MAVERMNFMDRSKKIVVLGLGPDAEFICEVLSKLEETGSNLREQSHSVIILSNLNFNVDYFDVYIIGESMVDQIKLDKLGDKKIIFVVRSIPPQLKDKHVEFVVTNYKAGSRAVTDLDRTLKRIA